MGNKWKLEDQNVPAERIVPTALRTEEMNGLMLSSTLIETMELYMLRINPPVSFAQLCAVKFIFSHTMAVSYHMENGKWGVTLDDPLEPQSIETVRKMLDAGEIFYISFWNADNSLPASLDLSQVNRIALAGIPCDDLSFLSSVKKLESLSLSYSRKPDIGKTIKLETIPSLGDLISLSLSRVVGLDKLPPFPNLKRLSLTKVQKLDNLPLFPKLETLGLDEINEPLSFLVKYPSIKDLFITGSSMEGANHLLHCKNLVRLIMIQDRKVDFEGMITDGTINHSLKILEISHCPSLTGFEWLPQFHGLKYMDIGSCRKLLSFKGIEQCKNLEVVNISECRVADKSLTYLANISKVLIGIKYSKEEIAAFEKKFKGEAYGFWGVYKGDFNYLEHYEKYFKGYFDNLPVIN